MDEARDVSRIFAEEPLKWGFRGDPVLWEAMRKSFHAVALPESITALVGLIEMRFEELTGQPLQGLSQLQVAQFAQGGMSSGMIDRQGFWIQNALPLLIRRYCEVREAGV